MYDWNHEPPVDLDIETTVPWTYSSGGGQTLSTLHRPLGQTTFNGSTGFIDVSAATNTGTGEALLLITGDPDTGTLTAIADETLNNNTTTLHDSGSITLTATDNSRTTFVGSIPYTTGYVTAYPGVPVTVAITHQNYDPWRVDNVAYPTLSGFCLAFFLDIAIIFLLRNSIGAAARNFRGLDQVRGVS